MGLLSILSPAWQAGQRYTTGDFDFIPIGESIRIISHIKVKVNKDCRQIKSPIKWSSLTVLISFLSVKVLIWV